MSAPPPHSTARFLTVWSVAGLVLLPPTVVVAWIAVLSTERGSLCLLYGEQCSGVPDGLAPGFFVTALVAGVLATAWPRTRWPSARFGAVAVQWLAMLTMGVLILSGP
ncbi:hypothetical protein WJ438_15710 [Streptomyces sp. GD-15H]|uniref:hypothetical protein n=1 Tax=Streptomyces sp. GD-15H TaxID=3129112 RepID=UPI003248BD96